MAMLIEKKLTKLSAKQKKKLCISINRKCFKLNNKIKKKTWEI